MIRHRLFLFHQCVLREIAEDPRPLSGFVEDDRHPVVDGASGLACMGEHAAVRYTSEDVPAGTVVFGDEVSHVVFDAAGVKCFVLRNEGLADSYAASFESAWRDAKV